jgi:myo-inositol 2-dehydrogenase / D-chiro-inositol 1-dehydrogenase
MPRRLRIAFVGAGSIVPVHMAAIESLDRADVVAVVSRDLDRARKAAHLHAAAAYVDSDEMLRTEQPDAVFVCVPPHAAPALCLKLAQGAVPFLVEKPVAALDRTVACKVAEELERRGLVAAVGYHLRGLDFLETWRSEIDRHPPELVAAWWMDSTPKSEWWSVQELSGGQVIEQMTHLYDLARFLLGEAEVVSAASSAASTSALLRFPSGAVGAFVNSHHAVETRIAFQMVPSGMIWRDAGGSAWTLTQAGRSTSMRRNPYAVQAAAFFDAVEAGDPRAVLATYADGLATHLLTCQVVAATADARR